MKILNYGSINVDHVYSLNHIVREGETISSSILIDYPGGKGANQSVALANAGLDVYHAGKIGLGGEWILDILKEKNVNVDNIIYDNTTPSGHTVIQVDSSGQNSIILFGGTNINQNLKEAETVLSKFNKGDYLVLQNEINISKDLIDKAHAKGMVVCLNPSPFTKDILDWNIDKVDYIFVNEIEASEFARIDGSYEELLEKLMKDYPKLNIIMTVGRDGAYYGKAGITAFAPIVDAPRVDTTAAGDTFMGFFLAGVAKDKSPKEALEYASLASSYTISRKGAMVSIPTAKEIDG